MRIERAAPANELLAKLIFLMLPTAVACYFVLLKANDYFAIPNADVLTQALYFAGGMGIAALLYAFRIRFVPTYIALVIVLYSVYKGLDNYSTGEFDTFFLARKFQIFSVLFSMGWLIGWGFTRLRYWSVFLSSAIFCSFVLLIAKAKVDSVDKLLWAFAPTVLYCVYIIFAAEQIYNYKDKSQKFWWFLIRRLGLFLIVASLFLGGVLWLKYPEIKVVVDNYGGGGKAGKAGMLKQNKDGSFSLDSIARLSSSLSRSNQLLFCAHIENYFPGTDMLNPLYLTAFYFTKFDTLTETFERDSTIPSNDLFMPDPSKMALFSTRTDSSVIKNSLGPKLRKTVDVEIYNKMLSPDVYLAPSVGFFVQPITVEKDFRGEFKSAYRAKSYVSELNNAVFVYNINKPDWRKFQEMRFNVLRGVTDFKEVDKKFLEYYTRMPGNEKFSSITRLAHKITDTAKTPVDKVLAIRNYFFSKDENGQRVYRYTDNPGVPDIPNASKLMYFLNENHKGYCAYYAGATLFMLRSLGIPSRIAVGFLTEDRSDKNKGWYWYYANQAHAWVQVFFPGYGWLDFDTTVGNDDENRPTPQPDGTPPMQPPKAWLAADGVVENVDTAKKLMTMSVKQYVFHDKEYKLSGPVSVTMDMKIAVIYRDSTPMPLGLVQKGDQGTAVSYAEALKKIEPTPNQSGEMILKSLPSPTPIDEVYLKKKETVKQKEKHEEPAQEKHMSGMTMLLIAGCIFAALLLFIFLLPTLILRYFIMRHNGARADGDKPYWAYRASTYYLHMTGMFRGRRTPMQYARDLVDPKFGLTGNRAASFTQFMNVYLKLKYAKQPLNTNEQSYVNGFLKPFLQAARKNTGAGKKFKGFLNPVRSLAFFMLPDEEEKDT